MMQKKIWNWIGSYLIILQLFMAIMFLVHDLLLYTMPFSQKIIYSISIFTAIYLFTLTKKLLLGSFITILLTPFLYIIIQWLFPLLPSLTTLTEPFVILWYYLTHFIPIDTEIHVYAFSLIAIYVALLLRALSRGKWQTLTLSILTLGLIEVSELFLTDLPFVLILYLVFWLLLFILYHATAQTNTFNQHYSMGHFIWTAVCSIGVLTACGWLFLSLFSAPPKALTSGTGPSNGTTSSTLTSTLDDSVQFNNDILFNVESTQTMYLRGKISDTLEGNTWITRYKAVNIEPFNILNAPTLKAYITVRNASLNRLYTPMTAYQLTYFPIGLSDEYKKSLLSATPLTTGSTKNLNYNTHYLYESNQTLESGALYAFSYLDMTHHTPIHLLEGSTSTLSVEEKQFDLSLPDNLDGQILTLANSITANETDPYFKALAIEKYFKDNFTYELNPNIPQGKDKLTYFLFEGKAGYCTYFASSMVLMLRELGIPARLAEGYLAIYGNGQGSDPFTNNSNPEGIPTGFPETIAITDKNAHAWVEAYIDKMGWVTFDPTANSDYLTYLVKEEVQEVIEAQTQTPEAEDMYLKDIQRNGALTLLCIILLIGYVLWSYETMRIPVFWQKQTPEQRINKCYQQTMKLLLRRGVVINESATSNELFEIAYSLSGQIEFLQLSHLYQKLLYGNLNSSDLDDLTTIQSYHKLLRKPKPPLPQ